MSSPAPSTLEAADLTDKRYFIAATTAKFPDTWDRCKEMGSWGATKRLSALERVQPGDEFLVWLGKKGFAARGRITSGAYVADPVDHPSWAHMGKEYPFRFKLEPVADYGVPYLVKWTKGKDPDTGLSTMQFVSGFTEVSQDQFDHYTTRLAALNTEGSLATASVGTPSPESTSEIEPADVEPADDEAQQQESVHNLAQLRLVEAGRAVGADAWVAVNDRHRVIAGVHLSDVTITELKTPGLSEEARRVVKNIDVLWLEHGEVVAAFEIESTTSIYSGLLRLGDLVATHPYAKIALYIVSTEAQKKSVCREINRPTFQRLGMTAKTKYLSVELLQQALDQATKLGPHLRYTFIDSLAEPC